jgi:hypothetical protein
MKKVPFLLLVVTLMLSVGFVFAGTPQKSAPARLGIKKLHKLPAPVAPNAVLYDQYDNATGGGYTSQDFEPAFDAYDNQAADDFVVPAGETWNIEGVDVAGQYSTGGPAAAFHVFIYSDAAGLPGTNVYTGLDQPYTDGGSGTDFVITLTSPAVLTEGTYWVSVQSRQDFSAAGQWFWNDRSVQSGFPAAWQNPGGGFGTGCSTWGVRSTCIGGAPDHVWRLNGTLGPSCVYANDFNDTSQEWIEEKPTVTQPGDGFLHLTPLKRKAVAVADAAFVAASVGTYTYDVQWSGGLLAKNWLYVSRVDKKNQLEILIKVGLGRVIVKDRNGAVLAKTKGFFTFAPNQTYNVVVNYDGANVDVTIDGTPVITDFVPGRSLPLGNTGAAAKGDSLLIDNFCFQ